MVTFEPAINESDVAGSTQVTVSPPRCQQDATLHRDRSLGELHTEDRGNATSSLVNKRTAPDMVAYYPLYVLRSDGVTESRSSKGAVEKNEPTKDQLDATPDRNGVSDFYREVVEGEAKEIDWRRKLGGMLMRELGSQEHAGKKTSMSLPGGQRTHGRQHQATTTC